MKYGVLLVNSGTPASLATRDVRAFLAGLLGDPRVVELPRWLWLPILHGIILRVRPRASAKKYAAIWTPQGSPLAVQSEALRAGLEAALSAHERARRARDALYGRRDGAAGDTGAARRGCRRNRGRPDVSAVLRRDDRRGVRPGERDARAACGTYPRLRFVSDYHDDDAYIAALAASVQEHWREHGATQHLVMSFHGIPERFVAQGDPYRAHCERTASLLAARLGLGQDAWSLTFQSRFGRARWLQPYTIEALAQLAQRGVSSVSVICPGFAADCLETLEEIGMENRDAFLAAGGKTVSIHRRAQCAAGSRRRAAGRRDAQHRSARARRRAAGRPSHALAEGVSRRSAS